MWSYHPPKKIFACHPFVVQSVEIIEAGKTLEKPFFRLECPDWVNVLPITKDGEIILIKQPRVGNEEMVLETPGGVCEASTDSQIEQAALRELEEETGYGKGKIEHLLTVNPNPATHTNDLHLFVASNLELLGESRQLFPDENERIEIFKVSKERCLELALTGKMNHALAVTCVLAAHAKGYL